MTRSQDIPKYYHPNGAIYLATVEAFLRAGTFFQPEMPVHEMDAIRSFDIDYPYQFTMAEELAKQIANNELSHLIQGPVIPLPIRSTPMSR